MDPIRPVFELARDFMHVLVTSKFDEYLTNHDQDSLSGTIFPLQVYGKGFRRSRAPNSIGCGLIWPKFELIRVYACPR